MKIVSKLTTSLLIASTLAGTAYIAQAARKDIENDANKVKTSAVSMIEAVNTALVKVPGTPSKAEFESEDNQTVWEIEIVSDKGVFDVQVDAVNGTILKQAADHADHDENDDRKDES